MKKCLYCKKPFDFILNSKKYCSRNCKSNYLKIPKLKFYKVKYKNCEYCNKKIKLNENGKKRRFCSKGCCRKAYRKTDKGKLGAYIYNRSIKRKLSSERYAKSEHGKLKRRLHNAKLRKNKKWLAKRNKDRKKWDNDYRKTLKGKLARQRYARKWYFERGGKEKQNKYRKIYFKRPEAIAKSKFRFFKRQALKKKATLKNLSKEREQKIIEIYKKCKKGYNVDHIIPLNNPFVCGLNVPENLKIIKDTENFSKGNRFIPFLDYKLYGTKKYYKMLKSPEYLKHIKSFLSL
jgi:hypothetical protein